MMLAPRKVIVSTIIEINYLVVSLFSDLVCHLFCEIYYTVDSDTVSTYQVSSVQLVTNRKLEAFNKA